MGCGNDGAKPSLALRYRWKTDALGKDPAFKEATGKPVSQFCIAHDYRRNRCLAHPRIEAQLVQSLFEERGVFPEPLDPFRFFLQNLKSRQTRSGDGGRMR